MKPCLGIVMDPIESINIKKDSSFAMLLEAQCRGWSIQYMEQSDLYLRDGQPHAYMRQLQVQDDPRRWYVFMGDTRARLDVLDIILMRKDPPMDMEYVYTTHLLELAEAAGVRVVNCPAGLRDANEKLFAAWFPQCTPPTLVSRRHYQLREFLAEHADIILKPLGNMGGASIFRVRHDDPNVNVIIETLTERGRRYVMAQRYIPEVRDGDKRILVIDGQPVAYALARVPAPGETRANLAVGAQGVGRELTEHDRWICQQVGPVLRNKGLLFVGLDVIGDYLTEINVTSPTCIRELDALYSINISAQFFDILERRLE